MSTDLVFSVLIPVVLAQPENGTVGFQSEPDRRGTISLLWQCLTTNFLCVYTVIHLNVPGKSTAPSERRLSIAFWVVFGLVFPEALLLRASYEWAVAWKFRPKWYDRCEWDHSLCVSRPPGKSRAIDCVWAKRQPVREHQISLKQAFFLLSRGVQIEVTLQNKEYVLDFCKLFIHWCDQSAAKLEDQEIIMNLYGVLPGDDEIN